MTHAQLAEYDRFLDENDWDIYYWVTQRAEDAATQPPQDTQTETWKKGAAKSGEWAQTVGAFKPAYRPVPARWAESEVLALLRAHVEERRGVHDGEKSGGGLGRMPDIETLK